jgi:pentatricopeptide repeat domain-containing protein 1
LKSLETIEKRGLEPDNITYSSAISACEKGGQWQQALALLDQMPEKGVTANVITCNAAISACEKGGKWRQESEVEVTVPPDNPGRLLVTV